MNPSLTAPPAPMTSAPTPPQRDRASDRAAAQRRERNFFTGMTAALVLSVVIGFAPTYYLKSSFPNSQEFAPPEAFFYAVHGTVCSAWMVLILVQTWLVRGRHLALHRRLGMLSVPVAIGVAGTGVYGALLAGTRERGFMAPPFAPEVFLLVPLLDAAFFALLTGAAIHLRRNPQAHKRLILLGTLSMCQAAFVRITPVGTESGPVMQMLLTLLFVVALAVWDKRTAGRVHPVTLWVGFPLFFSEFLRFPVAMTEAWQVVGRALLGLM